MLKNIGHAIEKIESILDESASDPVLNISEVADSWRMQ